MTFLTVDELITIHSKLTDKTGGLDGLRARGLPESAVYSANNKLRQKQRLKRER